MGLATQFFSDEQMERLRSYPDIGREELIRFFTLTRKDLGFIDNLDRGGGRGPAARLGLPVQLLANQLAVYPGMLEQYGRRAQTRSDHLKLVLKYLDWKPVPTTGETLKELEQFLLDRAMEHDSPSLLFHQAAEFLISARVVRPGVVTLMEMVATARTGAGALTSEKVDHLLTRPMRADLDRLLVHDPEIGATRLAWLTTPAVEATPTSIKLAIDNAKAKTDEALAERAKRGEARQLLMDVILPVLVDPGVPDEHVGGMLRERIWMDKLREVAAVRWKPLPRDHGRLAALEASYTYLRKFTPRVLAAVDFQGRPGTADLMDAVTILRELNRTGGRKVPAGAPTSFVPARYADYLAKARKSGDDTAFRHYWELCSATRSRALRVNTQIGGRLCRVRSS
ncbi:DUF4158 domain-containing protein [Nonomuraea angiospora]|uniref:DUF4158 domain-containing protein n=1 Tax=Nonomuraea angiospora TaxID=46172 RepID=UPI003418F465